MGPLKNWLAKTGCCGCIQNCRKSRSLVLVIVAIALLLDHILLTAIVPIVPSLLYEIGNPNDTNTTSASTILPTTSADSFRQNVTVPKFGLTHTVGNSTTTSSEDDHHNKLMDEVLLVGLLFASKAFVQLLVNPFIGPLTHRIGYSIPMFAGFVIIFASSLLFAFAGSYTALFLARALQGVGSACSSVAGMGLLAECYPDNRERGAAMGIALGGIALGVLIGPTFGGFMYEFVGKQAPFIVLACLALVDGLLQLLILQPTVTPKETEAPSLKALLLDPYIMVAAGTIALANTAISLLEPSLPIWMMDTMAASEWQQGVIFLPASFAYLLGTNLFGRLGHSMGRWFCSLLGLLFIGVSLICVPFSTSIYHLILPNAGVGLSLGMVDSSMLPELGFLVDTRHSSVYGSVYAIGDVALCLGFALGSGLSGLLMKTIGFGWLLFAIALLNILYAPLLFMLRNPQRTGEGKPLLSGNEETEEGVACNRTSLK